MTGCSFARSLAAAALVLACSSSSGSPSASGNGGGNPTLYGICASAGSPSAQLGMFVSGTFGFTLPVPAGQMQEVTLTVLNSGGTAATQMTDLDAAVVDPLV